MEKTEIEKAKEFIEAEEKKIDERALEILNRAISEIQALNRNAVPTGSFIGNTASVGFTIVRK